MVAPALPNLLSRETIERGLRYDDAELRSWLRLATECEYYTFRPREDNPAEFDEQTEFVEPNYYFDPDVGEQGAFVYSTPERFRICLGGTGSGKTQAAAYKTARHVLEVPPPRPRCPFWVIGESFSQVCQAAWAEKLSLLIPPEQIHSIDWYKSSRKWPNAVMLKHPTIPGEVGWVLEFKSYEQGFSGMKAVSIGGYWFNEEVPYHLVFEVQGRCRDYDSPGWADFTPIECRDPEWPESYEREAQSEGDGSWRFFHLNSMLNTALAPGYFERYLATVPEDMRALRQIGKFTVLAGAVYKEWNKRIHVIDPDDPEVARAHGLTRGGSRIPHDWKKFRGIDFGYNNPFCCLWAAKNPDGAYYFYDEHYESQRLLTHHVTKIHEREWSDHLPWFGPTYADHDAQDCAELASRGIPCTPARKAINQGIEVVRSLMLPQANGRPKLFIFSRCKNLIRELPAYRWPDGTVNRSPQDAPVDKDNHALDALRYVIYSDYVGTSFRGIGSRREIRDARRHGVHLEKRR